jgi:DNA-binding NtrC family response regulator
VPTPTATVVVLHSQAGVLELSEQALREAGHHVLVTREPAELLELARHLRIDVVVMDVARRDGDGIVGDVRSVQPHVRVVQEIGAGDSRRSRQDTGVHMLRAPFTLAELEQAVDAALVARPASSDTGRRVA